MTKTNRLSVLIIVLGALSGCRGRVPSIDLEFWAGDSKNGAITRSQENKSISCTSPEFEDFTALRYVMVQRIYDTLLKCSSWKKTPLMSSQQALQQNKIKNPELMERLSTQIELMKLDPPPEDHED